MKIVIADDSALLREGLAGLLERQGHTITAQASTAAELVEVMSASPQVDVLITDVRMPPNMADDGLKAALAIREERSDLPVMVLSQYVATALMQAGRGGLSQLTARETEVLELMSRGKSNREIADDLVISAAAVAKHVSNIFLKLNLVPEEENRRVKAILEYLSTGYA